MVRYPASSIIPRLSEHCSCGDLIYLLAKSFVLSAVPQLTQVEVVVLSISDGDEECKDLDDGYNEQLVP